MYSGAYSDRKNRKNVGQFEFSDNVVMVVKRISELDDQSFSSLRKALADAKLTFSIEELAVQISKNITSLTIAESEGIIRTVLSMYSAQRDSKHDWNELFFAFRKSLGAELFEQQLEIALLRMRQLAEGSESIKLIGKAMTVCNEQDKVFLSSRILSDVRPIFRDDEKRLTIGAAIILHSLKVKYRQGRELKDVYIAMDDEDLKIYRNASREPKRNRNNSTNF